MYNGALTDEQWCMLDLLMRARQKGVPAISRREILESDLPAGVRVRIVFQALLIPLELMEEKPEGFVISEAGAEFFNQRFPMGPTHIADAIIALPDGSSPTH